MTEVPLSSRLDCPHTQLCGGCALWDLDYGAQLAAKAARVTHELRRYGELASSAIAPIVPAPALTGYRVRAKLVVQGRAVGLFARGTHDVVDIPSCRLSTPRVNAALAAVRCCLPFEFVLSGVDVREVDDGTLVTLLVPERTPKRELERAAAALLAENAGIVAVSESRRAERAPRLLGSPPVTLLGPAATAHRLDPGGPYHFASPGSFVQAFPAQATRLYAAVEAALRERLGDLAGRTLLELFAGSGALALQLARSGAHVTAVDSHAPGIEALARAAREQGLELRARAARAETALDGASSPDAIIVDPPRRGLSPELRRSLARAHPKLVVYVSCEPSTLARDLSHLALLGYRSASLVPFDLIPLSDSVETLAVLEPGAPPPRRELHLDERWLVVDAPPHLEPGALFAALRAEARFASVVRVGAPAPSGLAVFARGSAGGVGECRAEYLVLARGITRARGRLGPASYERLRVVSTHSFLRVRARLDSAPDWLEVLARIGHPVLGELRHGDPKSNRHFIERHGLDRPFVHLARVELDHGAHAFDSALAADLSATLDSLERPGSAEP